MKLIKFLKFIILIPALLSCNLGDKDVVLEWKLPAADFDRQSFAQSIILPESIILENHAPVLIETGRDKKVEVPCQLSEGTNPELSWIIDGITKAGEERQYQLKFKKGIEGNPVMGIAKNDSTLLITKGSKEILHYRYKELPAPEEKTKLYSRSGFIHPLYSPSGECLTWAQPPDHIHHVGLWNPWTKVTWKGNHTDFWNLGSGLGTVRFREIVSMESGPVYAEFRVMQDHVAFLPPKPEGNEEWKGDEVVVLEEEWIIRVWNIEDGYYLDFKSEFSNILDEEISLDKYRYGGGLGYRATSEWNKDNSAVLTSEGLNRKQGDATRAKWCWVSGQLGGKQTGLLFMSDSTNYDFPQPMRIWPENQNGVGHQYFEFTPIREKSWMIEPGKIYSQNYRIWVKEGDLNLDEGEMQWKQFIEAEENNISYLNK